MEQYLEVKNLTKAFKTGAGVYDLSFSTKPGQIIGFVGDNGAGKTTTIRLIFGLLKKDSGEILLNGNNLFKNNLLAKVAFFPDQNNYPSSYKVLDYIIYNAELSGVKRKEAVKKANEILEWVNLTKNKHGTFKKLSSGMQKRALLASVLISEPEIIFLDEPTANLDVNSRVDFMNILVSLAKRGITIIITSHIIAELQEIINYLMIIRNGHLVYSKDFDLNSEKIQEIYSEFNNGSVIGTNDLDLIFKGKD